MRWHLVAPDGSIVRSADAGSIGEARFRLAPILPSHAVVSALSAAEALPQHRETPVPKVRRSRCGPRDWGVNEIRRRLVLAANVEGVSDAAIGRAVGVTGESVSQMRRKLGLPSSEKRYQMAVRAYWTLGWPDRRIAQRLGSEPSNVIYTRRRLGLPAHRGRGPMTRAERASIIGGDYAV